MPFCIRSSCSDRPAAQRQRFLNSGDGIDACSNKLARRLLRQELKHIRKRKAVLLCERDVDAVVRRRGLQLEVEATAESLAQRESPRLVEPPAKRRMQNQLLPTALIEETLGNNRRLRRHRTKHRAPRHNVADQLPRSRLIHAALALKPRKHIRKLRLRLIGCATTQPDRSASADSCA